MLRKCLPVNSSPRFSSLSICRCSATIRMVAVLIVAEHADLSRFETGAGPLIQAPLNRANLAGGIFCKFGGTILTILCAMILGVVVATPNARRCRHSHPSAESLPRLDPEQGNRSQPWTGSYPEQSCVCPIGSD